LIKTKIETNFRRDAYLGCCRAERFGGAAMLLLGILCAAQFAFANKEAGPQGFTIDLPNSETDVLSVVRAVADDHVVRGTYVYEREKILNEAVAETSSSYFGAWKESGKVFYKVRKGALAPRNFKDSSDIGEITVRYVVRGTSAVSTNLEILAVYVEDGSHRVHASNSAVETSEFSEIQKQLDALLRDRQRAEESRQKKTTEAQESASLVSQSKAETRYQAAESSLETLQQRADELQHAVEVRIANANTELKSAPFRGAATLAKLAGNSDVLVEIVTPYWYGVETTDGHRGWIRRDQSVPLP
jgi:hypothetical protein